MTKKLLTIFALALCLILSLTVFVGCGGNSDEGDGNADASVSKEMPATEAADPADNFVGKWSLAAAESEGVTMAGNFGEMIGMSDDGMLSINEDGSGKITLGKEDDDTVAFTWELKDDDTITVTAEDDTDYTEKNFDIKYKDKALFMEMEEDDQVATAIFTHNGTYPEAKIISMDGAEPITSEDELLGKWKMTAMNFMGISIYGSSEALENMSGGTEMAITFKEGGVASMETSDGTWEIGKDGVTLTSNDVTGTHTYPVKKLGDDIVIDMSESLGGTEFITLMSKAK